MKASEVIKIAEAELGYHEKASNAQLDDKYANSGSNNYTKYARDLHNAGYYQASKQGYEWCDMFLDWCFYQAAGKDKLKAETAECQNGTLYGAGCTYSRQYYKNKGRLSSIPQVGDQAFFSESQRTAPSNADHTGLVVGVDGNRVTIIEGNKNNQVSKNTYRIGDGWLYDFGHPYFDPEDNKQTTVVEKKEAAKVETKPVAITYVVKSGDTLGAIAAKYNTTVDKLVKDNNILNKNLIYVNQKIMINTEEEVEVVKPVQEEKKQEPTKPIGEVVSNNELAVGDFVKMNAGAKVYGKNYGFATWVYNTVLYVRAINGNTVTVSTQATGAVTGNVAKADLTKYSYKVKVTDSALNIRKGPSTDYAIVGVIKDFGTYEIVGDNGGNWLKLADNKGWIYKDYTKIV